MRIVIVYDDLAGVKFVGPDGKNLAEDEARRRYYEGYANALTRYRARREAALAEVLRGRGTRKYRIVIMPETN